MSNNPYVSNPDEAKRLFRVQEPQPMAMEGPTDGQ